MNVNKNLVFNKMSNRDLIRIAIDALNNDDMVLLKKIHNEHINRSKKLQLSKLLIKNKMNATENVVFNTMSDHDLIGIAINALNNDDLALLKKIHDEHINRSKKLQLSKLLIKEKSNTDQWHCECNFNSQFAYLVKKFSDAPTDSITITGYLEDKKLQQKVKNGEAFLVCESGNELIKYQSDKKKSHFKHKNIGDNPMSEWHRGWQECFENTEKAIGNRRADAVVNNKILEFQYSRITTKNIDDRTKNYNDYEVFWIIECLSAIKMDENGETYTITFEKDLWKYKNFINQPYIYLDYGKRIFRINPLRVKSNIVDVTNYKTKDEFIDYLNSDTIKWEDDTVEQGVIYHNQRGAGCGKTYESIQLLQNENQFADKEIFIYLTKVHSAKEVIYKEFSDQRKRGVLDKLDFFGEQDGYNDTVENKKYKITYTNKKTNKEIQIIIGTIDSFTVALGKKDPSSNDFFKGIINSIRQGYISATNTGKIKYAGSDYCLNKKCLVIIDEAQDLGPDYIEAFDMIVKKTGIDVYVIGDKLQSIWGDNNIYTFVEKNKLRYTKVVKDDGKNQVKRFHNIQFKEFVNKIIDFKKYKLPPIEDICDNKNCKYRHENDKKPYQIFQMPKIYNNDADSIKVNNAIEKIIRYVDNEINEYNYLPNNFMFIFPFIKKNYLAAQLEARLQDYWIKKFNDKKYRKHVLSKNDYWKEKIGSNKFRKYVYLHKSEDGQPINLVESKNATRMLSIHASKGNGCEVVFLLGVSEATLTRFSKQKCNIVYDSLLHVGITRQKKSIYVGLENNGDEINSRFSDNFEIDIDENIKPMIENIRKRTLFSDITDYLLNNDKMFENIYNKIIKKNSDYFEKKMIRIRKNNEIIDWGHHIVRNCMFFYNIMKNIVENENMEKDDKKMTKINHNF